MRPNILFWQSKSYFDFYWGRISYFHIQCPIFTFELMRNIVFWHSISYFDIRNGAEYKILTLTILFWHATQSRISRILTSISYIHTRTEANYTVFWHPKSYFDIQNGTEYRILTFNILHVFWHLTRSRISYFDIQNPMMTWKTRPNIAFGHQFPILALELAPNIAFWHSKSYINIRNETDYRILKF